MKAIILAGGFGTRLRPLSCTRPKMLFPVANLPLMDWPLMNLSKGGVDTAILAVNYMAEAIVRYLGPTKYDLGIIYSREQRPLGTGGPLIKAKDLLNEDEPFLVLNGDVVTDLDIRRLIEFHREKKGLATIALVQVPDPTRYGSVEKDWEGHVVDFVEKPEPGKAPSNLINAGVYVLEPQVLDYIQDGRAVSIEREVFPILAKEGKLFGFETHGSGQFKSFDLMGDVVSYLVEKGFKLGAYVTDAFWYDVGSLERYERLDNEALAEAMGFLF